MNKWIKGTFSDENGNPSFKRQAAFIVLLAIIGVIFYIEPELIASVIQALGVTLGLILGASAVDKFSKK